MEKLLFVYNPCSGKGQIRGSLSQVIEILSEKGYDVTVYPTKREMHPCIFRFYLPPAFPNSASLYGGAWTSSR